MLLNCIIQPTLALTRVSRQFGRGDFAVRARVYRNDELGQLCETFNDMADGICTLERDRLHFVASVAHDLKNPLIVLGGAARRIRKTTAVTAEQEKWLDRIVSQVTATVHIILPLSEP